MCSNNATPNYNNIASVCSYSSRLLLYFSPLINLLVTLIIIFITSNKSIL